MYGQSIVAERERKARESRECGSCGNKTVRELIRLTAYGRSLVSCKYGKGCNA